MPTKEQAAALTQQYLFSFDAIDSPRQRWGRHVIVRTNRDFSIKANTRTNQAPFFYTDRHIDFGKLKGSEEVVYHLVESRTALKVSLAESILLFSVEDDTPSRRFGDIQAEVGAAIDTMWKAVPASSISSPTAVSLFLEGAGLSLGSGKDRTALLHTISRYWHSSLRTAPRRFRPAIGESTLTDADELVRAFESPGLSDHDRRALALFGETFRFDEVQRNRILPHLWSYILEQRTSRDKDELIALGAAIRTLISYLPAVEFDSLSKILEPDSLFPVSPDIELEVAKGLAYRLSWDAKARSAAASQLNSALYDLACFHSSKRAVRHEVSNAIAVNSIIVLALFGDERISSLHSWLQQYSLPWFLKVARVRARHFLAHLTDDKVTEYSTGLLPIVADWELD